MIKTGKEEERSTVITGDNFITKQGPLMQKFQKLSSESKMNIPINVKLKNSGGRASNYCKRTFIRTV